MKEAMTFVALAHAAGCSTRTVRRYARERFPNRDFTGKARLEEHEARALMEALPKRNTVGGQASGQMSAQDIAEIVQATVTAMIPALVAAVRGTPQAPLALPAPAMDPRDELRRIINRAAAESGDHRGRTMRHVRK